MDAQNSSLVTAGAADSWDGADGEDAGDGCDDVTVASRP